MIHAVIPPCPSRLSDADSYTWQLGDIEGHDRRWREIRFAKLPIKFQMPVAKEYKRTYDLLGRKAANEYLLNISENFDGRVVTLGTDPDSRKLYAERRARDCAKIRGIERDPENAYLRLSIYVSGYGFSPPAVGGNITTTGAMNRMCSTVWWRRTIQKKYSELFECIAIRCGLVNSKKGMYVSDESLKFCKLNAKRNKELLESLEAVNELGQSFCLSELVAVSVANPRNRRCELMARLYGFDLIAKKLNHSGLFITITCPSRMHPRYKLSGNANPKFDGTTPRQANAYLGQVWARIRAKLQNDGIHVYGFRVAEPQHDGTPHWHILLYSSQENLKTIEVTCLRYSLQDSGDEKGAAKNRCKFIAIDWSKGSGIGYIAKYISKNIDGEHISEDINGGDAKHNSLRVVAWASIHRIRQFQQFGGPPVTCWRELRKIDEAPEGLLADARVAADEGDWEAFTEIFGGTEIHRRDHPLKLVKAYNDELGMYGDPKGEVIYGVSDGHIDLATRIHTWTISSSKAKAGISACG